MCGWSVPARPMPSRTYPRASFSWTVVSRNMARKLGRDSWARRCSSMAWPVLVRLQIAASPRGSRSASPDLWLGFPLVSRFVFILHRLALSCTPVGMLRPFIHSLMIASIASFHSTGISHFDDGLPASGLAADVRGEIKMSAKDCAPSPHRASRNSLGGRDVFGNTQLLSRHYQLVMRNLL